jgi:biotin transport system substrate-specific component
MLFRQKTAVDMEATILDPQIRGRGLAAVFVYLAMGAVGLPVFAGFSGSLAAVTGPTGGFLVGFLALVLFSAFTAKRGSAVPMLAIGLILCHLTGTLWFSHVSGTKFSSALLIVSLPYLWKDVLSCFFAYILASRLKKHLH